MYTKQELNISGRRSIGFIGKEIANESNKEIDEEHRFEWDNVRIYEISPDWAAAQEQKNGKRIDPYKVGVARCTKMEGDRDRYKVFNAKTLEQVIGIIRSHLPEFYRSIEEQLRLDTSPVRVE